MRKDLPKVKFRLPNLKTHNRIVHNFLEPKSGVMDLSNHVYRVYPDLKEKLESVPTYSARKDIVDKYFTSHFNRNKNVLQQRASELQESWDKINDPVMDALEDIMEIKWDEKKPFVGYVGLNPISPRDILGRSFHTYFEKNNHMTRRTVAHEISHFLWFDKWKKLFPDFDYKNMNAPALEWKLSETVPAVILADDRIQKAFPHDPSVCSMVRANKPVLRKIGELYDKRKSFDDFVLKSWDFVNNYKGESNGERKG